MIILSDLSEVLISGLWGTDKIIEKKYGTVVAKEFWERHLETHDDFKDLLRGKISEDCYWTGFLSESYWPFNIYELKRCFMENMLHDVPGTLALYKSIQSYPVSFGKHREMNYGRPEIRIVSDHIKERIPYIRDTHSDIFDIVKKYYWSFEIHMVKSDKDFFKTIINDTGVMSVDELLFIDDMSVNVVAARDAGINSIKFENADQLKSEMTKLGFTFKS